jgi:hypothetical protein
MGHHPVSTLDDRMDKLHLAKRMPPGDLFGQQYTALCDRRDTGWHGTYLGPARLRDILAEHAHELCTRCAQLGGIDDKLAKRLKEASKMPVRIDMTGATAITELIPEATYPAKVKACKFVPKAKSSGNPYLEFQFTIPEFPKRTFWRNYSLQPQALWALKEMLVNAFGMEVPDGEFEFEPSDTLGLDCQIVIIHEDDYRGRKDAEGNVIKRESIDEVLAPEGGASFGY